MAAEQRHKVRTQRIELKVKGRQDPKEIQDRFSRFFREHLLPLMEREMDKLSPPGTRHRIDRLEINLGKLSEEEEPSETARRFAREFARKLSEEIREQEGEEAGRKTTHGSPLDALLCFFQTGALPWWAARQPEYRPSVLLDRLLETTPGQLRPYLKAARENPHIRRRLIWEFSDAQLWRLCTGEDQLRLEKGDFFPFRGRLQAGLKSLGILPGDFRLHWWEEFMRKTSSASGTGARNLMATVTDLTLQALQVPPAEIKALTGSPPAKIPSETIPGPEKSAKTDQARRLQNWLKRAREHLQGEFQAERWREWLGKLKDIPLPASLREKVSEILRLTEKASAPGQAELTGEELWAFLLQFAAEAKPAWAPRDLSPGETLLLTGAIGDETWARLSPKEQQTSPQTQKIRQILRDLWWAWKALAEEKKRTTPDSPDPEDFAGETYFGDLAALSPSSPGASEPPDSSGAQPPGNRLARLRALSRSIEKTLLRTQSEVRRTERSWQQLSRLLAGLLQSLRQQAKDPGPDHPHSISELERLLTQWQGFARSWAQSLLPLAGELQEQLQDLDKAPSSEFDRRLEVLEIKHREFQEITAPLTEKEPFIPPFLLHSLRTFLEKGWPSWIQISSEKSEKSPLIAALELQAYLDHAGQTASRSAVPVREKIRQLREISGISPELVPSLDSGVAPHEIRLKLEELLEHLEKMASNLREEKAEPREDLPLPEPERLDSLFPENAGLVLVWPFLPMFFERLGWVQENRFSDRESAQRAALLLHYLVWPDREPSETDLPLNKLLCGLAPGDPLPLTPPPNPEERKEMEGLLEAVRLRSGIWGQLSADQFRTAWLQREGVLKAGQGHFQLHVGSKPWDVLLPRLPWGINLVKLPWMEELLMVEWDR